MRVLEPHHLRRSSSRRPMSGSRIIKYALVVLAVGVFGYVRFGQSPDKPASHTQPAAVSVPPQTAVLKKFSAEGFKATYNSRSYPNTQPIETPPEITGNAAADKRILKIAADRGYKLSALPVSSIVKTSEPGLEGDDLIQPNTLIAWQKLKAAAKKDGILIKMTSAYRSIEYQRGLFLRRMETAGVNVGRILEGFADDELETVLSRAAPPGYSRHHTGYTFDLSCNGVGLELFKGTPCYKWLSKNNYENIKKYGLVPSYPSGVKDVGPEPEPWEYIWVGTAVTYE